MNLLLASLCFAKTPSDDWQAVQQDLPQGWQITVVTSFAFPCIFVKARNDELICEPPRRRWADAPAREIHVRRDRIREIRVERREGANMVVGAGLGGGAGAGFGAIAKSSAKGGPTYLFGVVGALMGAHIARDIHTLRGKVIYRTPASLSKTYAANEIRDARDARCINGQTLR